MTPSGGGAPPVNPAVLALPAIEPPHSIAQARVDDKGRLKLPAEFFEYLKALNVERIFITTVDRQIARLYPIPVWKSNEDFFDNAGEMAELAEDVAYVAKYYGGDSAIDPQGRVLVPALLRELLELESQTVFLDCYRGRINMATRQVHEERLNRALANLPDKVKTLTKGGMK